MWIISLIIDKELRILYIQTDSNMHKYSVEKNTKSKMNKSYFCNINDQNRTFIFDAAQESVRCYDNEPKN